MMTGDHPIFVNNPINGEVELSTGPAPTPYHVYDGEGLLIFGHADADAVSMLVADEDVHLVKTASGSAVMGFIMADFREASMGPHHELQFFALVSQNMGETIADDPFAIPLAMAMQPSWGTLCIQLWNDRADVIAYNNEYLGLNAMPARFDLFVRKGAGKLDFDVTAENGAPILQGTVLAAQRPPLSSFWRMMRLIGLRELIRLGRADHAPGHVINRKSDVFPENRRARILTAPDQNILRQWDLANDHVVLGDPLFAALDFNPLAVQNIWPFRFVYLHPDH